MKKKRITIKTYFYRATTLLLALLVIVLISSCSSDIPQLCNVRLDVGDKNSRAISAVIDPLSGYTIYYRSMYKGTDNNAYGDMSSSSSFDKLTSSGILVSQGLWEIQAIFKETDQGNTYSPSTSDLIATSGNIFINMNTESISVSYPSQKGYVYLTQYLLR